MNRHRIAVDVPSAWTEPAVEESTTAPVRLLGRARAVQVPEGWTPGRKVRLLLLPEDHTIQGPDALKGKEPNPG